MRRLINDVFAAEFDNEWTREGHDGAVLEPSSGRCVLTTDSFVVSPMFFPGGDIGELAVCGTVNDLAMCGAVPRYLTTGFVIEEGLEIRVLRRVVRSMKRAADVAGVAIVTGDTKVVERGKADGLFINTAGLGFVADGEEARPGRIAAGDAILLSGDVGRHGVAVLAAREGLRFETDLLSDCAPVNHATRALIDRGIEVHCLRDLTRGGLATALVELATSSGLCLGIDETAVPVTAAVRGAAELFGLDPLYVANEGRFVALVRGDQSDAALEILRDVAGDFAPARIGEVRAAPEGRVLAATATGAERLLDVLSGEQLPRIC
jgi:hydrogenase expression/formation protein HypE